MDKYIIDSMYKSGSWWSSPIELPDGKIAFCIVHMEKAMNNFSIVYLSNKKSFSIQTTWLVQSKAKVGSYLVGTSGLSFLMNAVTVLSPEEFIKEYVPKEDWPDNMRWLGDEPLFPDLSIKW